MLKTGIYNSSGIYFSEFYYVNLHTLCIISLTAHSYILPIRLNQGLHTIFPTICGC